MNSIKFTKGQLDSLKKFEIINLPENQDFIKGIIDFGNNSSEIKQDFKIE